MKVKATAIAIEKQVDGLEEGRIYDVHDKHDYGYEIFDKRGCIEYYHRDWLMVVEDDGQETPEYTGASVSYYAVKVDNPTNPESLPYVAECQDIIDALGMDFSEGNVFKAVWRKCAARKFGKAKKGYDNGVYDSEKVVFFGQRMLAKAKASGDN